MLYGFFGGIKFDPEKSIPDLSGKVFLVTGGNAGLGREAIRQLAAHNPEHIYLAARTASKAEEAIKSLKSSFPDANITHIPLDLSSFASVKQAADTFKASSSRLDVLMNNAGVMALPPDSTTDGYEIQLGTNHLGHALLTRLLLPVLEATAKEHGDARIVNLTSEGHNMARSGICTDRATMNRGNAWGRYGNSKLANILFARKMSQLHPDVASISVHPGIILTDLYGPATSSNFVLRFGLALSRRMLPTIQQGAYNQVWAATCPRADLTNGAFYDRVGSLSKGSKHARSQKEADHLWEWTEQELTSMGY